VLRRLPTWAYEAAAVAVLLLATTALLTPGRLADWLAAAAVQFSFHHASVADRLAESEASRPAPSVHCHRSQRHYLIAKELFWVAAFLLSGLYPPLVGSCVFLLYPYWRRWYRSRRPLQRGTP
jgi:hypothetical protein